MSKTNTLLPSIKKKIRYFFTRHPILYFFRYLMLAQNYGNRDLARLPAFNDDNSKENIPPLFFKVNSEINIDPGADELKKALAIAVFLRQRTPVGPAVSLSSEETLQSMLYGKGGVCSDFSTIFNIFCLINDIRCREWNTVDKLYRTNFGHTFNEIYSPQLNKWIALDVHKGLIFPDRGGVPKSAVELFHRLRNGEPLHFEYYSDYRPAKPERIPNIYSSTSIPFYTAHYNVKEIDSFSRRFKFLPPFLLHAMMVMAKKNYTFVFVLDDYRTKLFPGIWK